MSKMILGNKVREGRGGVGIGCSGSGGRQPVNAIRGVGGANWIPMGMCNPPVKHSRSPEVATHTSPTFSIIINVTDKTRNHT